MKINSFEIANVLIVIFLLFILTRRRDVLTLLLVLFVYGTLHFGFAALALATNESASMLVAWHTEGSGVLARLSTLSLLIVIFALLSQRAYQLFPKQQRSDKKNAMHILVVMFVLLCGYFLNIRNGDWIQFRNVMAMEAIFALVLTGFLGSAGFHYLSKPLAYLLGVIGLLFLIVMDCIAVYEVFGHHSWAGTLESSGAMVFRASSLLFNPNLFGFWASLVYIACAYGMHAYQDCRKLMLWGMVLAAIAIYLSGSRSAGYLLLGILFFSSLLMRERLRWIPLITFPVSMLSIYALSAWIMPIFISSSEGWRSIALLGERLAAAPVYLISYILRLTGIPAEILLSIEGRFTGERLDAGWVVLYQDVGWLGLAGVIGGACLLIVWGARVYISHPGASSVYALAMLFYCLLSGFVMRFQIFPVWLFISIVLILCLSLWRQFPLPALRIKV